MSNATLPSVTPSKPAAPTAYPSIAIESIAPSPTNPRKTFDEAELAELAASIKTQGVLQPIVVRPFVSGRFVKSAGDGRNGKADKKSKPPTFELVAGERRWRAAKIAGLESIPVVIKHLDDRQVLEIQLTENEQRTDVHDLERSRAYAALVADGLTPAEVAKRIGKSESTVRSLLKLADLPAKAAEAFAEKRISSAVAQLIATRPSTEMRKACEQYALTPLPQWQQTTEGELPGVRAVKQFIRNDLMRPLDLVRAPTDRADLPGGSCDACPHRTGNNPELYPDSRPDVCTLPSCADEKAQAWAKMAIGVAKAEGRPVLEGKAAKDAIKKGVQKHAGGPYLDLHERCWPASNNGKVKTYAQALKKKLQPGDVVLAVDEDGELLELIDRKHAAKLVAVVTGAKLGSNLSGGEQRVIGKEEQRRKAEAKARGEAAKQAAELLADRGRSAADSLGHGGAAFFGGKIDKSKAMAALVGLVAECAWHENAKAVCRRRGFDFEKRQPSSVLAAEAASMDPEDAFGLIVELAAGRTLHEWRSERAGGFADSDRFLAAWGIDGKKLRADALAEAKKPKEANPAAKTNGKAKPEKAAEASVPTDGDQNPPAADGLKPIRCYSLEAHCPQGVDAVLGSSLYQATNQQKDGKAVEIVPWEDATGELWALGYRDPVTVPSSSVKNKSIGVDSYKVETYVCLPVITAEDFRELYPKAAIGVKKANRVCDTVYFGLAVRHGGKTYVVGSQVDAIRLVPMAHVDAVEAALAAKAKGGAK